MSLCDDCHLDAHREADAREVEEIGEDYLLYGEM